MSLSADELDPDDRLTCLAIFEHERAAAADRALAIDAMLERLTQSVATISDDAAARAQPEPAPADRDLELLLAQRCYREAALPLAALAGPITWSLSAFLG